MNTTINGQPMQRAIEQEVLRQIEAQTQDINVDAISKAEMFRTVMKQPRLLTFSCTSDAKNQEIRRRIWKAKRIDKQVTIDLRTFDDGKANRVAAVSSRTHRDLWEMEADWDILIDTTAAGRNEKSPE